MTIFELLVKRSLITTRIKIKDLLELKDLLIIIGL